LPGTRVSEFAQKAAENPAVTAGGIYNLHDEKTGFFAGTEARNRGHLMADENQSAGQGSCKRSLSRSEEVRASFIHDSTKARSARGRVQGIYTAPDLPPAWPTVKRSVLQRRLVTA
jgi:hypothetical protein